MSRHAYLYRFSEQVGLAEVRDSLALATMSAEGLHGQVQVRLEAGYYLDEKSRACAVDVSMPAGRTVAQIFTGLLAREFGEDAFTVEDVAEVRRKRSPRNSNDGLSHFAGSDRVSPVGASAPRR